MIELIAYLLLISAGVLALAVLIVVALRMAAVWKDLSEDEDRWDGRGE